MPTVDGNARGVIQRVTSNIVWDTLCGPHAVHAVGTGASRRYRRGFASFVGFANLAHPDLHALAPYAHPGECLYCDGWDGAVPDGWRIESECTMSRMAWHGGLPAVVELPGMVALDPGHSEAILELCELAKPGPFSLGNLEIGDYIGMFDGRRLVAMAGIRTCAHDLCEITGVCTHPDYRGLRLASRLTTLLIRRQMLRGEMPFLRVMRDNLGARDLYQRLGFRACLETVARTISRC